MGVPKRHRRFPRCAARTRSQSPLVESTTCEARAAARSAATSRRSCGGGLREARPQARVARVDAKAAARLRIGEPHLAHVDELRPRAGRGSRRRARRGGRRGRGAAAASRAGRGSRRRRRRAPAGARRRASSDERRRQLGGGARARPRRRARAASRRGPARPCRGGSGIGEPPPNETSARRGSRARSRRGRARARRPMATSALRRSAVPNPIDGVRSSTTQVTSTRSASCTLMCGSRVRAVTFQSIRRTSSPGS